VERIAKFWNDLKQFWAGLSRWQRLSIVGVAAVGMLTVFILLLVTGRQKYEPLFSNLNIDDQAAIVNYLKDKGIPYKVDPSFNAILVPTTWSTRPGFPLLGGIAEGWDRRL